MKIDKNIPIPGKRHGLENKWPMAKMKLGDSFLVKDKTSNAVISTTSKYGKQNNMKFTIRQMGHDVRVWRIK